MSWQGCPDRDGWWWFASKVDPEDDPVVLRVVDARIKHTGPIEMDANLLAGMWKYIPQTKSPYSRIDIV